MYKITLSDGSVLENLRKNGSNFVSALPLEKAALEGRLQSYWVDGPDSHTVHGPAELVQLRHYEDGWYFILRDLSPAELRERELKEKNHRLEQQVQALSGENSFLEDCIAEMAGVVYA